VAGAFSTANAKTFMNELDIVMHRVRGFPDYILMNDEMIRFFLRSCRELGYAPGVVEDPVLNMTRPARFGVPIYRSQFIKTVTSKQSIYIGRLGEGRGLIGIYPSRLAPPGIKITQIAPDHVKDFISIRVSWDSGIALYNESCTARLKDVGLPTEP